MSMSRIIKLLRYFFKYLTFSGFVSTIKTTLFRNDLIYVFYVDIETINQANHDNLSYKNHSIDGVIIKKGVIDELDDFCRRTGENAWEFYCHKFDGVKEFFIARDSDTIRHIAWVYKKDDPNRLLILGERDALLQYGLTLPQCRGLGLAPAVQREVMRYLKEQGCKRMYSLVQSRNQSSIRSLKKGGFVQVGKVRLIKIFGFQVSKKLDVSKMS